MRRVDTEVEFMLKWQVLYISNYRYKYREGCEKKVINLVIFVYLADLFFTFRQYFSGVISDIF